MKRGAMTNDVGAGCPVGLVKLNRKRTRSVPHPEIAPTDDALVGSAA